MSNRIELKVTIELSEGASDQEANVTENIMQALVHAVESSEQGIAGDDAEGYTTDIEVSSNKLVQHWSFAEGIETV